MVLARKSSYADSVFRSLREFVKQDDLSPSIRERFDLRFPKALGVAPPARADCELHLMQRLLEAGT
jgi:hypothetical protein